MFEYLNVNKFDRNVNDCTVRAISLATGDTWDNTYKKLSNAARERGMMMDNVTFIEDYLDERFQKVCNYYRKIDDFLHKNPNGTFIISMPGHLTTVIDGVNYDTFDTRDRRMWCAWRVK